MSKCTEIVRCKRTGNLCNRPVTQTGSTICNYHSELQDLAGPLQPRKCRYVTKVKGKNAFKRCDGNCGTNGYCGFHQVDTVSYRHNCGPDSICGCIHPGFFRQEDIDKEILLNP